MTALEALFNGRLPALVMFDLDGTLIDSVPDLAAAVNQMLATRGHPAVDLDQVRGWVGNGAATLVQRALANAEGNQAAEDRLDAVALTEFLAAYADQNQGTTVYPGVQECLAWLRARDVPLAVITNKPERFVGPLLKQLQLGAFRWVIGGDTLSVQKPDPAGLLQVMRDAGVSAEQCVLIGDSRNDVLAARAAGVKVIAVSYGYNYGRPVAQENPDLLVDSLDSLI